jgi:hypothetical protein
VLATAVGGGDCWWLVVASATAANVVLPFDLMHFTIRNLSLMYEQEHMYVCCSYSHLLYVCFVVLTPCSHLFLVPQTSARYMWRGFFF